jgi:hypothetical protein
MPDSPQVQSIQVPRSSIHAGDPEEVFVEEAKLLAFYNDHIERDADDILARFPGPEKPTAAATAYIAKLVEDVPDETIKSAVKRLATTKFRLRGML